MPNSRLKPWQEPHQVSPEGIRRPLSGHVTGQAQQDTKYGANSKLLVSGQTDLRGTALRHSGSGRLSVMTLDDELDRIFAARDRNNMQPTIDALLPLYASNPENARVLYEMGGAYDTGGQEEVARGFYERALAAGLEGDLLRRCYVQYGSTLRNVGEYEKSLAVFATARTTFPESPALGAFEAITLHAAGQLDAAVATLLDLLVDSVRTPDIDRYKPAISGNAAYIRSLERTASDASA